MRASEENPFPNNSQNPHLLLLPPSFRTSELELRAEFAPSDTYRTGETKLQVEEELEAFFTFHSRPTSLVSMVFSYPDSIYTKHDTDWENKREAKGGPDPTT